MDSAVSTNNDANTTPKSSITRKELTDSHKNARPAAEAPLGNDSIELASVDGMKLLASGGYNDIWIVNRPIADVDRYILRRPREDALLPDQVRNEVSCLKYVRQYLPHIPVPCVYDYSVDESSPESVWAAEEFIEGECLSDAWKTYDEATKLHIARQIAEIIVQLGETTYEGIGGLMPDGKLGPTVEGMKLFKGRDKFHSSAYYNIGPYATTKEYVLACYEKEIYYYIHAAHTDIDWDLFEDVSREDFIRQLESERKAIADDANAFVPDEPFVLVHGDLHGRNIMVKDGRIQAIIDWDFAGAYPLSELLGGTGVDVLEIEDEESEEECAVWSEKIVAMAGEIARKRGWDEIEVELLVGNGNPELQRVRVEMFP
ncbi:MAG: hypothetical protein Q9219_006086 [cf. Caloplaca sp. 3 TL-2023]